ncbi:MAG: preprotein translocase subunit YajC [Streptococcaceae bacterium]|jgi:preprotein translocase subunit YajC|nr:preprotein translocase subunit YajC [Streptococcaceae bacterium]
MGSLVTFLPIIVIMVAMMWFMQRSQKKQAQKRQEQLNTMAVGDSVVTIGGLHGIIGAIDETLKTVEINCEGVILTFDKAAIRTFNKTVSTTTDSVTEKVEDKVESPIEETK